MDEHMAFFETNNEPISRKKSPCMFKKTCENYTTGDECDNPKTYETRPCYEKQLNQTIAQNTQQLLGSPIENLPEKTTDDKPLTEQQMETLARRTEALCNEGNFLTI